MQDVERSDFFCVLITTGRNILNSEHLYFSKIVLAYACIREVLKKTKVTQKLKFKDDENTNLNSASESKDRNAAKTTDWNGKAGFMKPATYDASLRGAAQGVLGNLQGREKHEYPKLADALQSRFSPINQTELYWMTLKDRKLKPNESLLELGESVRRLTHLA
ncbi:unnamed protein product [Mytilus coruscus]|uniref:Uncharacterized protein n=1 Tax=Mytilus coruscus TaxID=42192 RepID=A0A6J8AS80_MYTCO|nr:unnamed protein product [Mytilus coruscus]